MPKVVPGYRKQAKDTIMDSATELFFESGYHETGMDDIAKKIGVTKGTLYLYFRNKEELLNETCKRNMALLEENLNKSISGDLINSVNKFFDAEMKMPDHVKFHWFFALGEINTNEYIRKILMDSYEKYIEIIASKIEELRETDRISKEVDPQSMSKMLIAFHNGILISVMQGLKESEAASIFKTGVNSILAGSGYIQ